MEKETLKVKDHRNISQGFGVCTIAVIFLYLLSGMNAVKLREVQLSLLMAAFTVCCIFYVVCAFVSSSKKYLSLLSAIPLFGIYFAVFKLSFDSVNRSTLACLSIMESVMFWAGLGTIAVSVIVLFSGKKITDSDLVTAVLCAGFVMRTVMVLFTPLNFWQHDVSDFTNEQAGFHDTYILYIYDNFALPSGDVRDLGQFYHPPLHYLLSAIFLKIHNALPLRFSGDINGLKMLPMLWTSYLILFAKKILEHFKINGKALAVSMALIVFCPQMIFLAIQVNNDALALMLFFASFFIALKWYSKPELTTIIFLALAIGCAMMTKLSMGFVAFPVAWLLLAKAVKIFKESKTSKDRNAKTKKADIIKQFGLFAAVVFPMGLWFPVKNLILYGTPITYVFEIDSSAGQDVDIYSVAQRFFAPSKDLLSTPFLQEGGPLNDYNILLALVKTGLFDERGFTDAYLINIAKIMVVLAFLLIAAVLACAVITLIKRPGKKEDRFFGKHEYISLWILSAVLVISECVFCFKHPVVCTQAFRYIAPVLISGTCWCGGVVRMSENDKADTALKAFSICLAILIVLSALSVILFYGPFAQYSVPWERLIIRKA